MPIALASSLTDIVAKRIGVQRDLAAELLVDSLGSRGRSARAVRLVAFAIASGATGRVLPRGVRRRALQSLLVPMLNNPRASNRYAAARVPKRAACSGLAPLD
jgi:hypothetical protein